MTDPTGRSFISYRRSRSHEISRLVDCLHERGVPTWRDVDYLNTEPTAEELRRVLRDDETGSVVLWIGPETVDSPMIRNVEAPLAVERHGRHDGFFVVPVAAGGLGYQDAAEAIRAGTSLFDLSQWNMIKIDGEPASDTDIQAVANRVLKQRLQAIGARTPPDEPLRISFNTRVAGGHRSGTALTIDWSRRFGGVQGREALAEDWQRRLLPALADVGDSLFQAVAGRKILFSGFAVLPAATALGYQFMATTGTDVSWEQNMPGAPRQVWGLGCGREDSGFAVNVIEADPGLTDLAVMVSVNNNVSQAVAASLSTTGPFRAT